MFYTPEELAVFKNTLKTQLNSGKVKITFTKKDGTERELVGTTNTAFIPEEVRSKDTRVVSEDVMPVFDVENNGWRSFRWDSVKKVTVL